MRKTKSADFEKKEHRQGYIFNPDCHSYYFYSLSVLFVFYLSFHKVNLFTGEYTLWIAKLQEGFYR